MFNQAIATHGELQRLAESEGRAGNPEVDFDVEGGKGRKCVVDYTGQDEVEE